MAQVDRRVRETPRWWPWAARAARRVRARALGRRAHPLRGGRRTPQPFFIIGSGRSANTLLRAMLVAGGEVAIPPENYALVPSIQLFLRHGHECWPRLVDVLVDWTERHPSMHYWAIDWDRVREEAKALPEEAHTLQGYLDSVYLTWRDEHAPKAARWADKTPQNTLHLPLVDAVYPRAHHVHLLRDGRDVTLSYVRAGIYEDPLLAARRWVTSVRAARRHMRRAGPRAMELRYEDLVRAPVENLERTCRFLGLRYTPAMLEFWNEVDRLGDTRADHHANLRNPINPDSIGKWRTGLVDEVGSADAKRVLEYLGPHLRRAGYDGDTM